jgi:ABC-type tungstate transport system substrate-binding protein
LHAGARLRSAAGALALALGIVLLAVAFAVNGVLTWGEQLWLAHR